MNATPRDSTAGLIPPDITEQIVAAATTELQIAAAEEATASITFHVDNSDGSADEVLRFEPNGRVYVRGELVDDNMDVYAALLDWGHQSSIIPDRVHEWAKEYGYVSREERNKPISGGITRYQLLKEEPDARQDH